MLQAVIRDFETPANEDGWWWGVRGSLRTRSFLPYTFLFPFLGVVAFLRSVLVLASSADFHNVEGYLCYVN